MSIDLTAVISLITVLVGATFAYSKQFDKVKTEIELLRRDNRQISYCLYLALLSEIDPDSTVNSKAVLRILQSAFPELPETRD